MHTIPEQPSKHPPVADPERESSGSRYQWGCLRAGALAGLKQRGGKRHPPQQRAAAEVSGSDAEEHDEKEEQHVEVNEYARLQYPNQSLDLGTFLRGSGQDRGDGRNQS